MKLTFSCNDQSLIRTDNNILAANSQKYVEAYFTLNWEGYSVSAVFEKDGKAYKVALIDNKCLIAHEVLKEGWFTVSLRGTKSDGTVVTSNKVEIEVLEGPSQSASNTSEPTPNEIDQIDAKVENALKIAQSVRNDADNSKFDGEDGAAATLTIGNVESVEPSESASVTNSGTDTAAVFNFKIPKGQDGDSLYAIGTLDELKDRCRNSTSPIYTVWSGNDAEVKTNSGQIYKLSAGNIYKIGYKKAGTTVAYLSVEQTKTIGGNGNLYEEAKKLISRFQTKGMKLPPNTNEIDIILFAGQSNSCGRALKDDKESEQASELDVFSTVDKSKAFTFHSPTERNKLESSRQPIIEPILANGAGNEYYGYVPTFLNAYYATTGRRACACFKSVGGMMMNNWLPYKITDAEGTKDYNNPGQYYQPMVDYINDARSKIADANNLNSIVGNIFLVWCQGENDAAYYGTTTNGYANPLEQTLTTDEAKKSYYKEKFADMLNALKKDAGVQKAFIVRIGHSNQTDMTNTRNKVIIDAQSEMCKENDDCVMVSGLFAGAKCFKEEDGTTRNLMKADGSHYVPEGYFRVGIEAGTNAGIYANTYVKPILLEYHRLYLDQLGVEDNTYYERAVDKYIYDPERVDISTMLKYTDYVLPETPEEPDEPIVPDEPEKPTIPEGYLLYLDFTKYEIKDYVDAGIVEVPEGTTTNGITYKADGMKAYDGAILNGLKLKTPIAVPNESWTVELVASIKDTANSGSSVANDLSKYLNFAVVSSKDADLSPAILCYYNGSDAANHYAQMRMGGNSELTTTAPNCFLFDGEEYTYKFTMLRSTFTAYRKGSTDTEFETVKVRSGLNVPETKGVWGYVFGINSGYTNAENYALDTGITIKSLSIKEGVA